MKYAFLLLLLFSNLVIAKPQIESEITELSEPAMSEPLVDSVEPLTDSVELLADSVGPLSDSVEPLSDSVEPLSDPVEPLSDPVELSEDTMKSDLKTEARNIITLYYAPVAIVEGDIEEDDFIWDDDYTNLTLDPGSAKGIRWLHRGRANFFLDYSAINTESESGKISKNKYQSMTLGPAFFGTTSIPNNRYLDVFSGLYLGLGGSRFELNDIKYRPHADVSGEVGVVIAKSVFIGGGMKYQIIGYPTETMAQVWLFSLNVGLLF